MVRMIKYDSEHFDPPAPIAHIVVLNHVTNESAADVPMLIDSGADVSLLPADVAARLGLVTVGEQVLQSYDGERRSAPFVEATVCWGKYTFKGQYVVGTADVGVLGREILNLLRLDLNGPELIGAVVPSSRHAS